MTPFEAFRRRGTLMESTGPIDPGIVHRVRFSKFIGSVVLYSAVSERLDERRRCLFAAVIEKRTEIAYKSTPDGPLRSRPL